MANVTYRYFVKEIAVTREAAVAHWHRSRTYRNCAGKRGLLFLLAEQGVNTDGEIEHLAEAGIRIEREEPRHD